MRLDDSILFFTGTLRFSVAANSLRSFTFSEDQNKITWENSVQYCEEQGGSLLSLYDEEDAKIIYYFFQNCTTLCNIWLGLSKDVNYTPTWSNGEPATFNKSQVDLKNEEILCEAFENGQWKSFNCSVEKTFMCQNGRFHLELT